MLTTKKIDDYFERELEQTAKKKQKKKKNERVSRRNSDSENTWHDSGIKITPLIHHIVVWIC